MSMKNDIIATLANPNYVPILKNTDLYYGGNQMWFPSNNKFSKDYILHYYGCDTIAIADLFLYLALQYDFCKNELTDIALQGNVPYYPQYLDYVHKINTLYTKTKRWLAVLGPKMASAINEISETYNIGYYARWKWRMSYYDMYEAIIEMLGHDIPVILSIGPNIPNLWGKKGISFYQKYNIDDETYGFKKVRDNINGHYVTVTAVEKQAKDDPGIMLRISSWGKKFYINYEEYREYIDEKGSKATSSIVYIK